MSDYIDNYKKRIRALPLEPAPWPWQTVAVHAIAGLMEVAFAADSELLLVISNDGRGVFDCQTGQRVARDDEQLDEASYDEIRLTCAGIGPLADQQLRIAGLHGGGLPLCTRDGWSLVHMAPDWPDGYIILQQPQADFFDAAKSKGCSKIADVEELRAFGFRTREKPW